MARSPSKKQLDYLKGLGYTGTPPITSGEASTLIDQLKGGMSPAKAEKQLLKYRDKLRKRDIQASKEYLNDLVRMNQDYPTCAGFRIKIERDELSPENEIYHKAFLPLEVAIRYVEAFEDIPGVHYDDELERVPSTGKFIIAPGKVVERKKGKPAPTEQAGCGSCGCVVVLAIAGVLGIAAVGFAAIF